jgi:DNA-binding response OmpR family regulator
LRYEKDNAAAGRPESVVSSKTFFLNGVPAQLSNSKLMKAKSRRKILVVDDDPAVRTMLSRVLAGEGYGVLCASDGANALQTANAASPDLVLLDLGLREKSGWEVFHCLTKIKPLVPVVIITGKANQLFTALSAGAGALLEKPLHFPKLLQTVRSLLSESVETRFARVAGKLADFHYLPGWRNT